MPASYRHAIEGSITVILSRAVVQECVTQVSQSDPVFRILSPLF